MIAIGYRKKIVGPADANGGKDNDISGLAIRPNEDWKQARSKLLILAASPFLPHHRNSVLVQEGGLQPT